MKFKVLYDRLMFTIIIAGLDVYFLLGTRWFLAGLVLAISIVLIQIGLDIYHENKGKRNRDTVPEFIQPHRISQIRISIP